MTGGRTRGFGLAAGGCGEPCADAGGNSSSLPPPASHASLLYIEGTGGTDGGGDGGGVAAGFFFLGMFSPKEVGRPRGRDGVRSVDAPGGRLAGELPRHTQTQGHLRTRWTLPRGVRANIASGTARTD